MQGFKKVVLILILITFAFYLVSNITMEERKTRYTEVFENSTFETPKKYLALQFAPACRLGNNLFELSSLIGMSKTLKRIPVVHVNRGMEGMIRRVNETIPGILDQVLVINGNVTSNYKKVFFSKRCCVFEDPRVLSAIDSQFLFVDSYFYQSYKYFPDLQKSLISWMRHSTEFQNLPESNDRNYVICAHTRRGDFVAYNFAATDENFLRGALSFIADSREAKKKILKIVMFGDDEKFMRNIFKDTVLSSDENIPQNSTHFVSKNKPSVDLIYSKNHCDVVLITAPHSTFGWWMGYVSKGNTVYYQDIRVTNDVLYKRGNINPPDFYLPKWTALRLAIDNVTVIESP